MKLRQSHLKIRAKNIVKQLTTLLKKENKIIDIGCGSGWISYYLKEKGFDVTLADVNNCNESNLPMVLFDEKLPFVDKKFDVALLVSVLHHSKDPYLVVKEAKRVAKEVIILEGIYNNKLENIWIYFWEWLCEMELGMLKHYDFYHFYNLDKLNKLLNSSPLKFTWNFMHTMRRGLYIIS